MNWWQAWLAQHSTYCLSSCKKWGRSETSDFWWAVSKKDFPNTWVVTYQGDCKSSCFTLFFNLQWFESWKCIFVFLEGRAKVYLTLMLKKRDEIAIEVQITECLKRLSVRFEFIFEHITPVLWYWKVKSTSALAIYLVWTKKSALTVTFIPGVHTSGGTF